VLLIPYVLLNVLRTDCRVTLIYVGHLLSRLR
jgi:hypothetical protein